ncbi:MAG: FmdB family zinc ribbon protein [Planctomycetota bacterium]
MPIYEYDCEACGHRFDCLLLRRDEEVACPQCGSAQLCKRFSVFAPGAGAARGGEAPPAPA